MKYQKIPAWVNHKARYPSIPDWVNQLPAKQEATNDFMEGLCMIVFILLLFVLAGTI